MASGFCAAPIRSLLLSVGSDFWYKEQSTTFHNLPQKYRTVWSRLLIKWQLQC